MRKLLAFVIFVLTSFVLFSCKQEELNADIAEITVSLLDRNKQPNPNGRMLGGEAFTLRIASNHSRFRVTAFVFEPLPDLIKINHEYQVEEAGYMDFTAVLPDGWNTRVKMSGTVEDELTGKSVDFSFVCTLFAAADASVRINNPLLYDDYGAVMKIGERTLDVPAVIGGDTFSFTIRSKKDKMYIQSVDCELIPPATVKSLTGKLVVFDKNGESTIDIKDVNITEDYYKENRKLTLVLKDEESGTLYTVSDEYVCLVKFSPSVEIIPSSFIDGGNVTVRVRSNRPNVSVTYVESEDALAHQDIRTGNTITLDGGHEYKDFTIEGVKVLEKHSGEYKLTLKDSAYTGRSETCTASYSADVKPAPKDVVVKSVVLKNVNDNSTVTVGTVASRLAMNWDDEAEITLGTSSTNSDGIFYAEVIEGSGVTISAQPGTGKILKVKADGDGKSGVVRIYAKNDRKVYKDLTVFVRHRVVLVAEMTADHQTRFLNNSTTGQRPGAVAFIGHDLMSYDNPNQVVKSPWWYFYFNIQYIHQVSDYRISLKKWTNPFGGSIGYFSNDAKEVGNIAFEDYTSPYKCDVRFSIFANPSKVKGYFLGGMKNAIPTQYWSTTWKWTCGATTYRFSQVDIPIDNYDELDGYLLSYKDISSTWSKGANHVYDKVSLKSNESVQLKDVLSDLQYYNDDWWSSNNYSISKNGDYWMLGDGTIVGKVTDANLYDHNALDHANSNRVWKSFEPLPYSVDYDKDYLDLRQVVLLYKMTNNGEPYNGSYWFGMYTSDKAVFNLSDLNAQ